MNRVRCCVIVMFCVCGLSSYSLKADVRADQKSHVEFGGMLGRMVNLFGGKAAREGVTSIVAVKADRKATLNEVNGQIVDLSEEKVYDLDMKRKTYRVTTFAELRRQMEEARQKAEEDARKEQATGKSEEAAPDENQKQAEVDFDVRDTGEKKTINGFDTHEVVMTITVREKGRSLDAGGGLVLASDMWLAPKIVAMKEIAEFDLRYARQLEGPMVAGASAEQMAAALAMYPQLKAAIARLNAEGVKMDGTAIQTMTKVEAVKSAEQMQQEQQSEQDNQSSGGGIGGRLMGGLARKMTKKKTADDSDRGNRATIMTLNGEVLQVTSAVSAADLAVPAGFQQREGR
jgi:hypothetical protein